MAQSASSNVEFPTLTPLGRQTAAPTVLLTQPVTVVGSSSRTELRLEGKSVSRFHCLIVRSGRDVFVRDLASRNGTYVNKNKIAERTLHGGDLIHVGDRAFQFRRRGSRSLPSPPLPSPAKLSGDDWAGVDFAGKTLLIGRREGCDVLLDSEDVAPAHAILFAMDGTHHLLDLHTPTGTRINGSAIKGVHLLSPGDEIEIAGSLMRYESAAAAAPASAPKKSKAAALDDSGALIPMDFDDEPEAPPAAKHSKPQPVAEEPEPQPVVVEESPEEKEDEPLSLADLRDFELPAEVPVAGAAAEDAALSLADEQPAPPPPLHEEAENNPLLEAPLPLTDIQVPAQDESVEDVSLAFEPEQPQEIPAPSEEPISEQPTGASSDIDDLALAALNEPNTPQAEAENAPQAGPLNMADDSHSKSEGNTLATERVPGDEIEAPSDEPLELAEEREPPEHKINATINVPPLPEESAEESVAEALTADAALDAILPIDLPEFTTEAVAIADTEESTLVELDGAVPPADAAPSLPVTEQEVTALPEAAIESPEPLSPDSISELPARDIIGVSSDDQKPTAPIRMITLPPPPPVAMEIDEEPAADFAEPVASETPAANIELLKDEPAKKDDFDFNDFNSLIDSLGEAPPGVPVRSAAAPPPSVHELASTEVAKALRAELGAVPRKPQPQSPTNSGIFSTAIQPGDVFTIPSDNPAWKSQPDAFGVPSQETTTPGRNPATILGSIPVPTAASPAFPRTAPADIKSKNPDRTSPPRRWKSRLWIVLLILGLVVVFWTKVSHRPASDVPVLPTASRNDAERASMRQTPP